jgi:DNA-binding response OmpR family regulator
MALALHRVLYTGNDRFDALVAGSAEVAREIVRDIGIDVLVCDADLPGMSGVDFVCWAAIEFPEMLFVVLTGQDVQRIQEKMEGLGCLRLVRKPCAPQEVLKIVYEALDCRHRLSGSFAALSAADLIQMLCLAQRTSSLRITAHGMQGAIVVKDGKGAASSLVDKGFAALRAGKVEEARKCWLAAKELDPDNRSLDLNLKKLESKAIR